MTRPSPGSNFAGTDLSRKQIVGIAGSVLLFFGAFAPHVEFQSKLSQAMAQMDAELADNPFRGLAHLAVNSIQLQWGWAVLIAGAVLLLGAAAMKSQQ